MRRQRAPLVALWAGIAVVAMSIVPGVRTHSGYSAPLDAWLGSGIYLVAAGVVWLRAVLRRTDRTAWALLGLGMACYAAANVVYYAAERPMAVVPTPSPSDLLYLAFYPCAYAFVVLQLRRQVGGLQLSAWLSGAVPALGAAALAAAFLFGTVVTATGGSTAKVVTNLAYPTCDLVLLTVVVGAFGLFAWRPPAMWWLVSVGMAAFAAADFVYLFEASHGAYQPGTWIDLLWDAGLGLLAVAAGQPDADRVVVKRLDGWAVLVVPSVFTLTSVGLLVVAARFGEPLLAVGLAASTVVVAVVRTWLTFAEVSQLADSRRLARTDDLTGLPNRRHLHQAVADAISRADGLPVAVLIMDLDRFKEVNDSLGHHVGDRLLTQLGHRLTAALDPADLIARLGGDEFGVLLPGADARRALEVAGELLRSLRQPMDLGDVSLHVGASVGVAIYPDHALSVGGLLQRADAAMYVAKADRSGVALPSTDAGVDQTRLETIEGIHRALEHDELVLHYQPKLDLRSGGVTGVEALVRWQHPSRGLLHPDAFLPLAEHAGLMRRLTLTVLELAARQAHRWRSEGRSLSVAVNLSASNLLDAELPGHIKVLLAGFDLPTDLLELEVTETVLMADPVRTHQVLRSLRALGLRLAIDDYGTGYSSLAYLQDLPVDDLKLDRSFVARSATDPRSAVIVTSTISLAHALDMRIVAEGVETAEVLEVLAAAGCDIAQGYHIARPQPAAQLECWLDGLADLGRARPVGTRAAPPDRPVAATDPGGGCHVLPAAGCQAPTRRDQESFQRASAADSCSVEGSGGAVDDCSSLPVALKPPHPAQNSAPDQLGYRPMAANRPSR